ncbi:MAG: hypothetical protein P8K68_01595 [Algibacter sp.]|uniref:hypothetical protein n=1 Tax=Algibacter sp. TaxID=1872428 RepID=UPI0026041546|nr:hypothetical protein [Algibacter sp.]MDG1731051.1 hypothetical protein [Algibacter sp.]MDG2177465.1 hypothetical protein [Algibacter sp.]
MKKLLLLLITITFLIPKQINAQKDGAAVAAVAGGLLAIGAGIAAVEQMKEQAELRATQWVLSNRPELESFSLQTLAFNGKKMKDMSSTSVITYKIQEFNPTMDPVLDGRKQVLFGFTSHGWLNQSGINFDKVRWHLVDSKEWMNMMVAYVKVSSDEKDESTLNKTLLEGKVVNKGIKVKSKLVIPFFKLTGDMYVVTDYSSEMKLLYNERSLGIFLKETKDLVQMGRGDIIDIHEYFFDND